MRDRLHGGLADGRLDRDFDPRQLAKGIQVELEHTGDVEVAKEIAKDHLTEISDYYDRLEKMEKHAKHAKRAERGNPYPPAPPPGGAIVDDTAWNDPDDLWGIGFSDAVNLGPTPQRNPSYAPAWAHRLLVSHGLYLSANPKTIFCVSTPQTRSVVKSFFELLSTKVPRNEKEAKTLAAAEALTRGKQRVRGTCQPTRWCIDHCYGWSINFQSIVSVSKFISNAAFFEKPHSRATVTEVSGAIKAICKNSGVDAIRWSGIGDITPGMIPFIDELTADGDFIVYGFSRKGDFLAQYVPVRDNIVFWCSVDNTMDAKRLRQQLAGAETHRTAMGYATSTGAAYGSRTRDGKPTPPWEKPARLKAPKMNYAPGPDPFLARLQAEGYPVSVVFGYHGAGRLTRVSVDSRNRPLPNPSECPATDPLGGGHFLGACLVCGWCIRKPHRRPWQTLADRRRQIVDADSFTGVDLGLISLDTGEPVTP